MIKDRWVRQPSKNSKEVLNLKELINDDSKMRKFLIICNGKNRENSLKNRNGAIVYEKIYSRGRLIYVEEIRKNRHELAAKTMYWQATKK